jgi:hypothetical protein
MAPPGNGEGPPPQTGPTQRLTSPTKSLPTLLHRTQLERQRRCPLVRGACRTGEPAVVASVLRLHRPWQCPAAQRRKDVA